MKKRLAWALAVALGLLAVGGVGTSVALFLKLAALEARVAAEAVSTKAPSAAATHPEKWYSVRKDDDIVSIAIAFGITPSQLLAANDLRVGYELKTGQNLRIPDAARNVAPSAVQSQSSTVSSPSPASGSARVPPGPTSLEVAQVDYDGENRVSLHFNTAPDLGVLRDYLTLAPLNGAYSIEPCSWNRKIVWLRGDLPYRTNVVLRLRAGFPQAEINRDARLAPLASDFMKILQRKDASPSVEFVHSGHYLPPGGARTLAIDSVNVSRLHCAAAAVPSKNVVQLLARDVGNYSATRWEADNMDSRFTRDLADVMHEWDVDVDMKLNAHVVTPLALRTLSDAASNGVFLVSVGVPQEFKGRRPETSYRLVCLTDIGLTVREDARSATVWATSLTTGAPATNCLVEVYAKNNRLLGSGRTDEKGLCVVDLANVGEAEVDRKRRHGPFAVVATAADGHDVSFICLENSHAIDEINLPEGARPDYLCPNDVSAFVWTERDIYRHDEPMFVHALVRNGRTEAPKSFPVEFRLLDPECRVYLRETKVLDALGAAYHAGFTVPAEKPSGRWTLVVATPGEKGSVIGSHVVSVEEFAPPRVRVHVAARGETTTNFSFTVTGEHLYGGPAKGLFSEGAVVFTDTPFAPAAWKGWTFGDADLGLKPNWRRLPRQALDKNGQTIFWADLLAESGRPRAAVRAIGEGTVLEEGGRPARARAEKTIHYYPYYIGTTLGDNVRLPQEGCVSVKVACVLPNGKRLAEARRLQVKVQRIENVYGCRKGEDGWTSWVCDRVRTPVKMPVEELEVGPTGDTMLDLPLRDVGDYVLTLLDESRGVSFGKTFWLGGRGDGDVRAPLANPAAVTVTPDKKLYRPGDVPRLLVKAPFAGWAMLSVMREKVLYSKVWKLAGATEEITLDSVDAAWAPNVDVAVSVVQSAENDGRRQTARAHGETTLCVRRPENEIPVTVKSAFTPGLAGGGTLTAEVMAASAASTGAVAVVTVVDEGIHLLTNWRTPDPVGRFGELRGGTHPLFDLFNNLLPVWDGDPAKVRGVKTGGGAGEGMLGRVSAVPTRRFRPLARWQAAVPLTNGVGRAVFELPEFVGEVRVTAVAYSAQAVGAGDVRQKVAPKVVMECDAPRFAAPGDAFAATLTLVNHGGAKGDVKWTFAAGTNAPSAGMVALAEGASTNLSLAVRAPSVPGELKLVFGAEGHGERHEQTIALPVRPAVAARERSGVDVIAPGESRVYGLLGDGALAAGAVRSFTMRGDRTAELAGALDYLADYPHGCLEQTSSRIFPLVTAGGFLNALAAQGHVGRAATNRAAYVEAGVRRVESMIRAHDFVMWPDCTYAPWDREVSLWACHFLVEAERSGVALNPVAKRQVGHFLETWSRDRSDEVSAYACHVLALASRPARDRMLVLFDRRTHLSQLSRTRLARAFAQIGDRDRARELLVGVSQPQSVKEAAFAILACLELDPADERILPLVDYLTRSRGKERYSWGTTCENAHALLALGCYFRHHPVTGGAPKLTASRAGGSDFTFTQGVCEVLRGAGDVKVSNPGMTPAWLAWRTVEIPRAETVTNEACRLSVRRVFLTPEGTEADLAKIMRGDLLFVELSLVSTVAGSYNDLVVQDLLPAAFEPVLGGAQGAGRCARKEDGDWVMRSDARDDRMLVFSKKFGMNAGEVVSFRYPVRVVSCGDFALPGPTVEAMYVPEIHAAQAPARMKVAE